MSTQIFDVTTTARGALVSYYCIDSRLPKSLRKVITYVFIYVFILFYRSSKWSAALQLTFHLTKPIIQRRQSPTNSPQNLNQSSIGMTSEPGNMLVEIFYCREL